MNESSPKVSIVLPTYNGSKYIRQSIDSCLNQTYRNIELIIIDDGSTDSTTDIVKSYQDNRIFYYRHKSNKGLPGALNTGFSMATGEYLTWTSDDNYYAEKAINRLLLHLKETHCQFVYSDYYMFSEEDLSNLKAMYLPEVFELKNQNCIGACFLYTKEVKDIIGIYDPETSLAEDYDYWIRVSKKFDMIHINEILYYYRIHPQSLTETRYHEVKVVDTLVKLRHELISTDEAISSLVHLKTAKSKKCFQIHKLINKCVFSNKFRKTLSDFEKENLGFKEAVVILKNML